MHTKPLARPSSRRILSLILRSLLFAGLFLPKASPALAATTPVTFTIFYLSQTGDNFDTTTLGDFYAEVSINGHEQDTSEIDFTNPFEGYIVPSGNLLPSPWVVTENVPSDALSVPVHVEVWDSDIDPDDQADINPGSSESLDLEVNIATGKWSGDVNWPENCIGAFDLDGNTAEICFDVNTVSVGGDLDEDGLPDNWEQKGVDFSMDGTIDIDLPAFGASAFRKDVFVEMDCLVAGDHSHCLEQNALSDAVDAFARAPVGNADGTSGVQLHIDVGGIYGGGVVHSLPGPNGAAGSYGDFGGGNTIPEAGNEIIESFAAPKGNGVPFDTLKGNNFDPAREPIFHYAISGHQTNYRMAVNDCTSGEASGPAGHDFMVTLGGIDAFFLDPCWGVNPSGLSIGIRSEQAGTFIHELGHSLGLLHGGDVAYLNNKPNYLSVMNYAFQMCDVPASPNGTLPGGCDYSRIELLSPGVPLAEDNLDECLGIDAGALGFGPVNWDKDTLLEGITNCQPPNSANVMADINGDSIKTILNGFEDWSHLDYLTSISGAGGTGGIPDEADPQTIKDAQDTLGEVMAPDVVVTKTGPATALPGDTLNYSTEVKNQGFGPALEAVLTDTDPDGTSQDYDLGALPVGDVRTQTSSFTLPAEACPGDLTEASASVAFKDMVGHELSASDTAPLEILDIVPPTISVSVSPTILWPPDHKFQEVTATITVADDCDPNPTVTLVSITSNEPETGFLGNGDQGPDVDGAAFGTDDRLFSLRSERGTGGLNTGRMYTITYRATDASGNTTDATAIVTVPTDFSQVH